MGQGSLDQKHLSGNQVPACLLSGTFAHLALFLESGCHRSAYLATMLLEQIASLSAPDGDLPPYARQLAEALQHVTETSERAGPLAKLYPLLPARSVIRTE